MTTLSKRRSIGCEAPTSCRALALAAVLCCGCGSGNGDDGGAAGASGAAGQPAATETGRAELTFTLTEGAKISRNLVDPLMGQVRANIFHSEDIRLDGPRPGTMGVQPVAIDIDLEASDPSQEKFLTNPIEPGSYTFLGFLDLDGNGATTNQPDSGDPATLPNTNQFDIVANETVQVEIVFDLVL